MTIESTNPATGKQICTYDEMSPEVIRTAIQDTHLAWLDWRRTGFQERTRNMQKAAAILRKNTDVYARIMTEEMGKPVSEARGEIEKCAWVCDYYADNAEVFLQPETVETDASKSFISFQPLGMVLAVMPWNFPFWQVFRFAAPALMAGNAGVLKHASNVSGCALAIETVFREAGFPEHLFTTLIAGSSKIEAVIENPKIAAVTLTGSTPAGSAVAKKAGEMLKKSVLELGGSDPYIILADADLEETVTACVNSRLINGGQSCIAAKRFIVPAPMLEDIERLFVEKMSAKKMGDPLQEDTDIGPQARHDLRDELHRQVTDSIKQGARVLCGGEIPDVAGAYYPPTVLTGVTRGMRAFDEELFGPVAALIPANDEIEAINLANDSSFGLGAAVFTGDPDKGERIATYELEAGSCFVNDFVKSDPRLPFGGIKQSGYGRELSSFGIREFVNIKTVYVK